MKERIGIVSLGCPRNLVDSENIIGRLSAKGHKIVDIGQADVAIVNTCAFIDEAKRESIDAILGLAELKKQGKIKKIIVYGCLAQRYQDELRRQLPEVDAFVGTLELTQELKGFRLTPKHYAYLKICEGCVNHCSYCVIPGIKGRFRSADQTSLLRKVSQFNQAGISELNIIGQDITGFGLDLDLRCGLVKLIKSIVKKAARIHWIRLLYLNPERVDRDLISLIKNEKKLCKYIDLPIQHINNRILRLMRRKADRAQIIALIKNIRQAIPGVCLRTSIIAGFPSETGQEFKELLDFIREIKFERLGAFIYSREEGTAAYNLPGQLPQAVKQERFDLIMRAQQEVAAGHNREMLGEVIEVLVEEAQDGVYLGRTAGDAPEVDGLVYVNSKKRLSAGQFIKAKVTDYLEYDLVAEVLK